MTRHASVSWPHPEVVAAAAKEEFAKVGDEEIMMLCCDSWRLGGAMEAAVRVLRDEFGWGLVDIARHLTQPLLNF